VTIATARSSSSLVAAFLCDVDRFKLVNDSYGHRFGDVFLVQVAERLRASIRPTDIVARIGGDEFMIVLSHLRNATEALELADRTRRIFAMPFNIEGAEIASSVSIGVAIGDPSHPDTTPESMIRDADTAVYQAKDAGRDSAVVFDASMRDRVSHRLAIERDLRHALERHELTVNYQPIVDLVSGRVSGFEALLRWAHPTWGQVAPASFIPVAEDTGLIVDIGEWVLHEACMQLAVWRETLPRSSRLQMSVNLSARQLRDPDIVERVHAVLAESGLPRDALTLELTESTLMENPSHAAELLGQLKNLGIGLSIDDFGTGYSSLAYLRRFPVDVVKIDRAFVIDVEDDDTSDATLVAAIVAMAGALGICTVAEGVETLGQARRVAELGCDLGQGYLYSRAVEPAMIPDAIAAIHTDARGHLQAVRTKHSA
jgi:diguanylate cyclase (GGDEF)-like protein